MRCINSIREVVVLGKLSRNRFFKDSLRGVSVCDESPVLDRSTHPHHFRMRILIF